MSSPLRLPRLRIAAALAVLLGLSMWPGSAHLQDGSAASSASPEFEQARSRFDGTWELAVSRGRAQQVVNGAIERAVAAMNFFVRGVARDQLRDNTPINRTIVLDFQGSDRIRVRFPDTGWQTVTRIDRPARARSTDGDDMRVTQRFRDGALEQVFETDAGTRWNVYTSTGDGTMRCSATTQGMMMPEPMRFELDYRRR